ncbi:outer membrane usher protein [Serratia fonticola]|uniref:outer membrane usher protein n=1 Tax=Serratia fonticola TaxID=47917 RepID=UPI003AAD3E15
MAKGNSVPCFRVRGLWLIIALTLGNSVSSSFAADEIQFNTDVLDIKDRENYDLSVFSRAGYVMPGTYPLVVKVNQQSLPKELPIQFSAPVGDPKGSEPCLTPELIGMIGFRESYLETLTWNNSDTTQQCLDQSTLQGWGIKGDLSTATLNISVPQAYLEYQFDNWDPPSRWDNGVAGILFDYNANTVLARQQSRGQEHRISANGTTGANLGAWRLRADWQYQNRASQGKRQLDWSRYYAYRTIPNWLARLTVGESFLNSDVFDSFRFTGVSLNTEDQMLPPNLRGYAPEVTGVANTNATVTVRQQGRVLYQTQVAPGPFRIQDLSDAVNGQLDIEIAEQDGEVRTSSMNTSSIPYLTRPGLLRYKLASGRPSNWLHDVNGPLFATGEFSWGVSNGWSLYGGAVGGSDYNALALGVGRDLMLFGALSFDMTQSHAQLPYGDTLSGGSYRLSYSKRFDDYDSQVTFAGYRFSEHDFMSMSDYLDAREYGKRSRASKEMYTVSFNQQVVDLGIGLFLNYSHQGYWDASANERYSLSLSRIFDIGKFKNLNLSLTAYRNQYNNTNDDGAYLSLSMPWGSTSRVSYSGSWNNSSQSNQVAYSDQLNNNDNYQVSTGNTRNGVAVGGFYTHVGTLAQVNANASYEEGSYSSLGLSLQGGMTATAAGVALHRNNILGGTRIMADAAGVAGVPIRSYGANSYTNAFGKVVIPDVNNYYRNSVSVDQQKLGDNFEVTDSVKQVTLTEGAIGYRSFDVVVGEKAMAIIRLVDGSAPPFGASVFNDKNVEVGIVSDGGNVYLTGIQPNGEMSVSWGGKERCRLTFPAVLSSQTLQNLLLPCR